MSFRSALLVTLSLFVLASAASAQQLQSDPARWLEEQRSAFLLTARARALGLFSEADFATRGLAEVLVRVSSADSAFSVGGLEAVFVPTIRDPSLDTVMVRLSDHGLAYAVVRAETTYRFELRGEDRHLLGAVRVPRSGLGWLVESVVGRLPDGRWAGYVGVASIMAPSDPGMGRVSIRGSLGEPPSRIDPLTSMEALVASLPPAPTPEKKGDDNTAGTTRGVRPEPARPARADAPPANVRMTADEARKFEIDPLDPTDRDPEVRRIWRLIANTKTPRDLLAAQEALRDYYLARGDTVRARISEERARFWREQIGS